MGLGKANDGSGTKYLKIAGGAIWQTANIDPKNELYTEEDWEMGDKTGTRKGYKCGSLSGRIENVFLKENQYGEFLNVYIRDNEDELYALSFKIDKGWTAYSVAKRMMTALLFLDLSKDCTIHVGSSKGDNDFLNVILWVSQGDKNLVLNPNADPEKFDSNKQTAMPEDVKEMLSTTRTTTAEERKVMNKKQKERSREDELDDLVELLKEFVMADLNKEAESTPKPKAKVSKGTPIEVQEEAEIPDDVQEEAEEKVVEKPVAAAKETGREKLERLRREREAKAGK